MSLSMTSAVGSHESKRAVWEQLRVEYTRRWSLGLRTQSEVHETQSARRGEHNPDAVLVGNKPPQQDGRIHAGEFRTTAPGSPLSIRIPIASLDPVAPSCMRWSDCVFSPTAILFLERPRPVLGRDDARRSLGTIGGVRFPRCRAYCAERCSRCRSWRFCDHEIDSTNSACGRVPATRFPCRCGRRVVPLFLMPSSLRRCDRGVAATQSDASGRGDGGGGWSSRVCCCVIAILGVGVGRIRAEVRLAAMNVVLICGVSTVLFNATPLMRYDGYFHFE